MSNAPVTSLNDELLQDLEFDLEIAETTHQLEATVSRESLATLIARLRAAEKDAARYRWLRDKDQLDPRYQHQALTVAFENLTGGMLDHCVDTVMENNP